MPKESKLEILGKFLRRFDFSHSEISFSYDSEYCCSTIIGIFFILYIILGLIIIIMNFIPFIRHQNFTLQYYTMNLEKTENIYLNDKSNAFAFGLDCADNIITEEAQKLLELSVQYKSTKYRMSNVDSDLTFHKCKNDDFLIELNNSYENLKLSNYFCLNKDDLEKYSLSGIYTDDVFKYYIISITAKKDTEEDLEKINQFLYKNNCKLQYYLTDAIFDLDNYDKPIIYFIDSLFLQINPNFYSKKNIFYMNYHLYDSKDNNFFSTDDYPEEPRLQAGLSRIYDYFEYKGFDISDESIVKTKNEYARIYLRADNKKIEIKRHYDNIMEFYGDNYIILDLFDFLCFLLGIITAYLDRITLQRKIFLFEDDKHEKDTIIKIRQNLKQSIGDPSKKQENKNRIIIPNTNSVSEYTERAISELKNENKKKYKRYNATCCEEFTNWLCACKDNTYQDENGFTIESPNNVIDSKFDASYYIKKMMILDLIQKYDYEEKHPYINIHSVLPAFKPSNAKKIRGISSLEDKIDNINKDLDKLNLNLFNQMDKLANQMDEMLNLDMMTDFQTKINQ